MVHGIVIVVALVANLKIVKPAIAPPAPVQVQPAMRRYRDLPPPYDLIEITEEQYRQLKVIQKHTAEEYERLEEELRQLDDELRELDLDFPKEPLKPGEGDGEGVA